MRKLFVALSATTIYLAGCGHAGSTVPQSFENAPTQYSRAITPPTF
jgi:hypothetical protein